MDLASKTHPTTSTLRSSALLSGIVTLVCIIAPLMGCSSKSTPANNGTASSIKLLDENNYTSTSILTLPTVDTKAGTNLDICWTELTQDLQCHTVDPQADIDTVALARFIKTHEEAQKLLISGDLDLKKVDRYLEFHTDHQSTCTNLSLMTEIGGTAINISQDYAEGSQYSYVLIGAHGTSPGSGARAMRFLNPLSGSDVTAADIPQGCHELDFKPNLHSLTKVAVPIQGPWVVDWSGITKDSEGKKVIFDTYVNGSELNLTLGFYQGKTVTELEDQIFDIETIATKLWQVTNLPGTTKHWDLALAPDKDDNLFPGFQQLDGIWAMAIHCPSCQNPTPIVITIIDPIGGDQ